MSRYDVYGIGNAIVDTEFRVTDATIDACRLPKGVMTLVDDDRQRELVAELSKIQGAVNRSGGGSAANTMVAVAQFGGTAYYTCKLANDPTGDFFLHDLQTAGVDSNCDETRTEGISGECLSLITPDAERTLSTCLGVSANLSAAEINEDALANSRYLYLEGYLVSGDDSRDAMFRAMEIAKANDVTVSLTLSDPAMAEHFREVFDDLIERGVDLLFCNEDEAKLWLNVATTDEAVAAVHKRCPAFAVTTGATGALVSHEGEVIRVPGSPATPVDTTGAGDMFAGAFLWALTRGSSFPEASALANKAAATVVSNYGARLNARLFAQHLKEAALAIR